MDNMKIACCVYGDKNIFYKDIIVLNSVARNNYNLDLFVCSSEKNPSSEYLHWLHKYNIYYLPFSNEIEEYASRFASGFDRYPKEVFIKFYLPICFGKLGYDYTLLIDYDIICLKNYNWTDILPVNSIISYRSSKQLKNVLTREQLESISLELGMPNIDSTFSFPNAGFLIFNNKIYHESEFCTKIVNVINMLFDYSIYHPLDEVAFGLSLLLVDREPLLLSASYNVSAAWGRYDMNTRNFHYNSHIKPWNFVELFQSGKIYEWHKSVSILSLIVSCKIYADIVRATPLFSKVYNGFEPNDEVFLQALQKNEVNYRNRISRS